MSRLQDSYDAYRKKNERLEPVEYFHGTEAKREILQGAVKISSQTKDAAGVYGSVYEGTFIATDGRVFELWLQSGWIPLTKVWASKESWEKHRTVLPFNIWAWG